MRQTTSCLADKLCAQGWAYSLYASLSNFVMIESSSRARLDTQFFVRAFDIYLMKVRYNDRDECEHRIVCPR